MKKKIFILFVFILCLECFTNGNSLSRIKREDEEKVKEENNEDGKKNTPDDEDEEKNEPQEEENNKPEDEEKNKESKDKKEKDKDSTSKNKNTKNGEKNDTEKKKNSKDNNNNNNTNINTNTNNNNNNSRPNKSKKKPKYNQDEDKNQKGDEEKKKKENTEGEELEKSLELVKKINCEKLKNIQKEIGSENQEEEEEDYDYDYYNLWSYFLGRKKRDVNSEDPYFENFKIKNNKIMQDYLKTIEHDANEIPDFNEFDSLLVSGAIEDTQYPRVKRQTTNQLKTPINVDPTYIETSKPDVIVDISANLKKSNDFIGPKTLEEFLKTLNYEKINNQENKPLTYSDDFIGPKTLEEFLKNLNVEEITNQGNEPLPISEYVSKIKPNLKLFDDFIGPKTLEEFKETLHGENKPLSTFKGISKITSNFNEDFIGPITLEEFLKNSNDEKINQDKISNFKDIVKVDRFEPEDATELFNAHLLKRDVTNQTNFTNEKKELPDDNDKISIDHSKYLENNPWILSQAGVNSTEEIKSRNPAVKKIPENLKLGKKDFAQYEINPFKKSTKQITQ